MNFYPLNPETLSQLAKITPERHFISYESIAYITSLIELLEDIELKTTELETLRAIRNSIVRYFDTLDDNTTDFEALRHNMTRVSMIVFVIDQFMYKKDVL